MTPQGVHPPPTGLGVPFSPGTPCRVTGIGQPQEGGELSAVASWTTQSGVTMHISFSRGGPEFPGGIVPQDPPTGQPFKSSGAWLSLGILPPRKTPTFRPNWNQKFITGAGGLEMPPFPAHRLERIQLEKKFLDPQGVGVGGGGQADWQLDLAGT